MWFVSNLLTWEQAGANIVFAEFADRLGVVLHSAAFDDQVGNLFNYYSSFFFLIFLVTF